MYPSMVFILFLLSFSNKKIVFVISSSFFLLFFIGTYGYGYDWVNYYRIYSNINFYESLPFEPGYYYVMKVFHSMGANFSTLTSCVNFFISISVINYCRKKLNRSFAIFCFFSLMGFFMFMEQIRQGIAVAILLYVIDDINKRKSLKKFYFGVILAMFFHGTSFIALFFPLLNKRLSKAKVFLVFIISIVVVYGSIVAINYPQYVFIPYIKEKLISYGGVGSSLDNTIFNKSSLIYLLFLLPPLISSKKPEYSLSSSKSIISVFFIFETKLAFFLLRFQYYFFLIYIDSMDLFLASRKNTGWLRVYISCLVLIISYMPYRYEIYKLSIGNPLTFLSDKRDIDSKIIKRCSDLYKSGGDSSNIVTCKYI